MIGCLRLVDVSVICRVGNPRRTSQKTWGGFLYGEYLPGQGKDFELIPTIKANTRHPVERILLFVNYRRSVIIASYDGLKLLLALAYITLHLASVIIHYGL